MSASLTSTVKAGRLIRLMGWINLVFVIGIGAAIAFWAFATNQPTSLFAWVGFLCLVALSVLYLLVGAGIKNYKHWAKVLGALLSLLSILNFPIGTLLGILTLYYLVKGWNEPVVVA
jgi:hypothetical protein